MKLVEKTQEAVIMLNLVFDIGLGQFFMTF